MPKNPVPPKQPRQKRVRGGLFPAVQVFEEEAGSLVEDGEAGQVGGVLPRRFEDEPEFLAEGAGAEEEDHYEGVGEADFGAVDGAIAQGFEEGEGLVVGGVEEDVAFEGGLGLLLVVWWGEGRGVGGTWRDLRVSIAAVVVQRGVRVVICGLGALGGAGLEYQQLIQRGIEVKERREEGLAPGEGVEGMTIIAAGDLGSM